MIPLYPTWPLTSCRYPSRDGAIHCSYLISHQSSGCLQSITIVSILVQVLIISYYSKWSSPNFLHLFPVVSKYATQWAASETSVNLVEMQIIGPLIRPTESAMYSCHVCFNKQLDDSGTFSSLRMPDIWLTLQKHRWCLVSVGLK